MIIKNVKVYTPERTFEEGEIVIRDGVIGEVRINRRLSDREQQEVESMDKEAPGKAPDGREMTDCEVIDGQGCYAIPGLIDLHFHGCVGHDFCDGTKEAIGAIAKYEASVGVTAICPATMTLPVEELEHILAVAAEYKRETEADPQKDSSGADLIGINMEGPFISPAKKGAQDARNIIPCDTGICQRFLDASEGLVKFVGIAPEESDASTSFIAQMKDRVHISLAHTNADYDTAKAAYDAGASHAVHLYNAMPPFTHRAPGVVGAVADSGHVTAELICDGVHIHPSVVRSTFGMMGADRMILISDSMRATGMPDGRYLLGGLEVDVVGNRATLVSDGALAGSATNLADCMRVAVKQMGLPLETAVACATANPARKLGVYDQYGSIEAGKKADVVLLDRELDLKLVVKDGKRL